MKWEQEEGRNIRRSRHIRRLKQRGSCLCLLFLHPLLESTHSFFLLLGLFIPFGNIGQSSARSDQ